MAHPFRVSSDYGPRDRGDGFHNGVDFDTPDSGAPLGAARAGVWHYDWDAGAYGRIGWLQADDGNWYLYAHLARHHVADGARVRRGQLVALSGGRRGQDGAGNSTGSHLHYEIRVGGRRGRTVNPDPNYIGGLWAPVLGEQETFTVSPEDEAKIRKLVAEETRKVIIGLWYLLTTGTENKTLLDVPASDDARRQTLNLQKILQEVQKP